MRYVGEREVTRHFGSRTVVLLPFVLVSFAANSLITRYVVAGGLLDAGLLSAVRFIAGAVALIALALVRRERLAVGRANLLPALWLGIYAVCISYGYQHIGAAAGTFVFYATVLVTLTAYDLVTGAGVPRRRLVGALVSLAGVGVLASDAVGSVTVVGVVLLVVTGAAWGMYTIAGRGGSDPRVSTTGNFILVAAVALLPAAVSVGVGSAFTTIGLLWAVVMGAATTAFAYVAWYACQRRLSGTGAGSAQLVIPVLTGVGAVLLLGERPSVALLVAAVLVGGGMWLGTPKRAAAEPRP